MSQSISVPAGLDKMTPDEQRVFESMRADDDAPEAAPEPTARATPEPAPAAEETPEIDIEDDAAPASDGKQKLVPHAQFHAANERRKAAEAKAAAAEQRAAVEAAKFAERLNLLTQAVAAQTQPSAVAAPAAEIPDINTDPVGHFSAQLAVRDQKIAQQEAILRGMQEQGQQQQQAAELRNWAADHERAFAAQEPTYTKAMDFLTASRRAELSSIGVTDPAQQMQIIGQDVAQIAARSRAEGANFAQRLYGLAEARGFQKPSAAAPVVPGLEESTLAAQAERAAAGRESATTIGTVGAAPPTRLSPEKIANMSDRDFGILVGKMKGDPAALRRLMGE